MYRLFLNWPHRCGGSPTGFGSVPHRCGGSPTGFGSVPHRCGGSPTGFGSVPHRCGGLPTGFGDEPHRCGRSPQGFAVEPHRCGRPGGSEFQAGAEFDGERTDVATCHDVSGILSGVFLFDQFGTGDAAFGTRLVQEVHDGAAQGKFLVHLPVQSAEGLPAAVEVVGVVDVGVGLAEVAEAGPDLRSSGSWSRSSGPW